MRVRPLRESDIPILRDFHRQQGFDYPFPDLTGPLIEAVHVVADDDDNPVAAGIAERKLEGYFIAGDCGPKHAKFHILRLLHDSLARTLTAKGYRILDAHLPPSIERLYGRLLTKRLGWVRNWTSFGYHKH